MNDDIDTMNEANDRTASPIRNWSANCKDESEREMIRDELNQATDPLDADEEREVFRGMVQAAADGDDERRNILRARILKANIRLALYEANKLIWKRRIAYGEYTSSLLDLQHVAYEAIYCSMDKFNVDLGCRFSTYVTKAIRNGIYKADGIRKRHENGVGPMRRLDEPIRKGEEATWMEFQEDGDAVPVPDMVDSRRKGKRLGTAMRSLSTRERELLAVKLGVYGDKCRLADMAHKYGITPARASQIVQEGVKKLRRHVSV